jgi:DNA-binding transcriptional regulator YiaG
MIQVVTSLVLALTSPDVCPNGARHNTVHAGLVYLQDEWLGIIRVIWNSASREPENGEELTLQSDTVLTWAEKSLDKADSEMVNAAWFMGAWDLSRTWHLPLGANADPLAPHHGLVSLFDLSNAYAVRKEPMGIRNEPINPKLLLETAAQDGWIAWKFRPVLRSTRVGGRVAARDITLERDGTRIGPIPVHQQLPVFGERHFYQLGRENTSVNEPWTLNNQGATLRAARKRLGISAEALAARLRLGENGGRTVRRWEAGQVPISGPAQVAIELFLRRASACPYCRQLWPSIERTHFWNP